MVWKTGGARRPEYHGVTLRYTAAGYLDIRVYPDMPLPCVCIWNLLAKCQLWCNEIW